MSEQDRYDRAIERAAMWSGQEPSRVAEIVAAFSAELERQGVRLVPLAEVVVALRGFPLPDEANAASGRAWAHHLERRFGGSDER